MLIKRFPVHHRQTVGIVKLTAWISGSSSRPKLATACSNLPSALSMLGLLCTLCLPVCLTRSIQRIGHKYPTPGHNPYTPYSQHPDQQYSVLSTGVPGHIPADVLCRNPTLHHKREQETSPNPHKNNIVIFLSSGTCIPIRAKSAEKPSYSPETSPQSVFLQPTTARRFPICGVPRLSPSGV